MAKKSARSKGYRKYHQEVKGYTPAEKKAMIIGFSVIAVLLIAVLVLPDFIESFSLLKVKDGVVQDVGDNWLLCDVGTSSKHKYRKLAEFSGEIEGYQLASTEDGILDKNLKYYVYEPTAAEGALAQTVNVQSGNGEASELSANFLSQMSMFGEILSASETVEEGEINGMKTYAVSMQYRAQNYEQAMEQAEAAAEAAEAAEGETAETPAVEELAEEEIIYDYNQSVVLYIDADIDGKCIVLNAMNAGDSDAVFQDTAAMQELLKTVAEGITLA